MSSPGKGQLSPAAVARFRFSWTVLRATPSTRAISRLLAPSRARRSIWRSCLMVSFLFAGIPPLRRIDTRTVMPELLTQGAVRAAASWPPSYRNGGRLQSGTVAGFTSENLAGLNRNLHSCRDWHQLLEICALFDTLIADSDGILDPALYNDRLLLGLKGTMSEAELHILKNRMHAGRQAKAQRGELFFNLPRGFVRRPGGEIALDPDEQVQASVRLVFDLFDQRRTINGVLVYLAAHDIRLPYRQRGGPAKGELVWRRPNRYTLKEMLTNPAYAGAYVYGRRSIDPRRQRPGHPGSGRIKSQPGNMVLLKDRWPAYISWEDHERNCAQVSANRTQHPGVPVAALRCWQASAVWTLRSALGARLYRQRP